MCVQWLSRIQLFAAPWTAAHRLPCPLLSARVCSNSCPLSWWCYLTNHLILCHPLLVLPSIFPSVRSFLMSQLFASGGQSIRVSVSASVLPMNIQCSFTLGLTGLTSVQSKGLSTVFSSTTVQKHQFFGFFTVLLYDPTLISVHNYLLYSQPSLWFNSHIHTWLLGKP